jgi:hypothetical protein
MICKKTDNLQLSIIMPRIDDYINAKKIAVQKLEKEPFDSIVKRSGFETVSNNLFEVPFLNRTYNVTYPGFEFEDKAQKEKEVPIQEQVLILHYMMADIPPSVSGRWIAYREIPGASFYFSAFVKRAVDPLKNVFGSNTAGFVKAAEKLNGKAVDAGDVSFEFTVFPKVPLQLIIYEGDDEFSPEANILFDETAGKILLPEDAAWLSGMVVYRLMALAK